MYRYATFKTRAMAIAYLEHGFASGTISPAEFAEIKKEHGRWHIMLRL